MAVHSGASSPDSSAKKGYEPAEGSWVAELEAAVEELTGLTNASSGGEVVPPGRRGDALKAYLRVCRARSKLRQWKELEEASDKGVNLCSSLLASSSNASRIADWKARFEKYRETARRELAVETYLPEVEALLRRSISEDIPLDMVSWPDEGYKNSNLLQFSAIIGDMRLMETVVAHGAALDAPFLEESGNGRGLAIVAPTDATALVILCAMIATHDLDHPAFQQAKAFDPPEAELEIVQNKECAMQLVRLGADMHRKLNLCNAHETYHSRAYRMGGFDGKSAYELAKLTIRTDLIELMEQHLQCSSEERAQLVHCRCGSRLPWKSCHSFGVGLPPHYFEFQGRMMYRMSPLARCPCNNAPEIHYKCCWKDTSVPMYLIDADGNMFSKQRRLKHSERLRELQELYGLSDFDLQLTGADLGHDWPKMDGQEMAELIRTSPDFVQAFFAEDGPKSKLLTWDMEVYAGCLERLETPFFWKDLHWRLNKPELLLRVSKWNAALQQYCDDVGLEGVERDRVVAKHMANPCAPCGRVGCDHVERQVREYQRCSRCKMIAYCGRSCQKADWRNHRKSCIGDDET